MKLQNTKYEILKKQQQTNKQKTSKQQQQNIKNQLEKI